MIKRLITSVVAVASMLGLTQANALIIQTTDSIKSGSPQHFVIDGNQYLLRAGQLGELDTTTQTYRARLANSMGTRWNLALRYSDVSDTFPAGNNPRCPQANPGCDTNGWVHFLEDPNRTSVLTRAGGTARYRIDLGWGQAGLDAGGVLVTPNGGYAAGFWIKEWTYQERATRNDRWMSVRTGRGGDLNVYAVSEPATLALLGLGALGLMRRRRS